MARGNMKTANCVYLGLQHTLDAPIALYNLKEQIAEHPINSTVSEISLASCGYEVPAIEAEKARIDKEKLNTKQ